MADIFREVEEEVRRERLEKIWKEYGDYIIAGVSLLVIGAAGYRLWIYYDARERAQASNQYMLAQQMLESGQSQGAAQSFGKLAQSAPSGYARMAQLQEANALLSAGNKNDAIGLYKRLMANNDPILSALARLRLAWATVDGTPKSEIQTLLAPLTNPTSPWRATAGEVLAYADYRNGQTAQAIAEFKRIAADPKAPTNVRQRSQAMATFLSAGGERDSGEVPMPPVTASKTNPSSPMDLDIERAPGNPAPPASGAKPPNATTPQAPGTPAKSTVPQGQAHK